MYIYFFINDKMYEATAVILATGMEYTKPIKGEIELLGKGVGYCATCDAPLYKGKTVSIIGYNKEAEDEANKKLNESITRELIDYNQILRWNG